MISDFSRSRGISRWYEMRIGVRQLREIWASAAQTKITGFGLQLAQKTLNGALGPLDALLMTSATILEALATLSRYVGLVSHIGKFSVVRGNGLMSLRQNVKGGVPALEAWMTGVLLSRLRAYSEDEVSLTRVSLMQDRPANTSIYDDYFRCSVDFQAPYNQVSLNDEYASARFETADPDRHTLLKVYADGKLEGWSPWRPRENDHGFLRAVEAAAEEAFYCGSFDQYTVARLLGLSTRTLQRRLQHEGVSFRALSQRLYHSLSERYLSGEYGKESQLARGLYYSSQSSFQRARAVWRRLNSPK